MDQSGPTPTRAQDVESETKQELHKATIYAEV